MQRSFFEMQTYVDYRQNELLREATPDQLAAEALASNRRMPRARSMVGFVEVFIDALAVLRPWTRDRRQETGAGRS
jgi:hypothetical protein